MRYLTCTLFCIFLLESGPLLAQPKTDISGTVKDVLGKPLAWATITILHQDMTTYSNGNGEFAFHNITSTSPSIVLQVSYVGKTTVQRTVQTGAGKQVQHFVLADANLKLREVEVTGVRKSTANSNSSIIFDRIAIEQTQALSVVNVLNQLPGQTILKPVVSIQGIQPIVLRAALAGGLEEQLNNAFGVSLVVDGNNMSNNANMQASNTSFMGLNSANNVQHPENGVIPDRSARNGSLYSSYSSITANNGVDLRQIPAENIESIEVITGVASARYGDYTTGVINITQQAGITPWRISTRINEGTYNVGLNKGIRLSPQLGALNFSFDYLNSNDDPRNKLKAYQRISAGGIWSYQNKSARLFKNTISFNYSTTIDQTRLDPDQGNQRMAKFNNKDFRISNRSQWILKKSWLYDVNFQVSYSRGRQESYDQWYLNSTGVIPVANALETSTYEGYFMPGYYLAYHHILGEPVNATARLEASNVFKLGKHTHYRLTAGSNFSYSANKGPGTLNDPNRPRFDYIGFKNDRPRSFDNVPGQKNLGFYIENAFTSKLLGRPASANIGVRADQQNGYFVVSPRVNANMRLLKNLTLNMAYGIATKSPSLSQISPGNVYFDLPLVNSYNGYVDQSVYYVHTQVVALNNLNLKPYKSFTYETGLSWNSKIVNIGLTYFNRITKDGFAQVNTPMAITVPNYTVTQIPGSKPSYAPDGTYKTFYLTYNKMANGSYSATNGLELIVGTAKIKAIQTSFNASTALYLSKYLNNTDDALVPDNIDLTRQAIIGIYRNQEKQSLNIKSTIVSNTHIPALRMAIVFTGEFFWVNKTTNLTSAVYPSGYLDANMQYYPLTAAAAQQPAYAHLVRISSAEVTSTMPSFVYPNVNLRLSKEIGDALRFSFSAFNVFNIRPIERTVTGISYYNGQPAYGAELLFTIK